MIKYLPKKHLSLVFLLIFGLSVHLPVKAQSTADKTENLWYSNYPTWRTSLKSSLNASDSNFRLFMKFYKDTLYKDRAIFYKNEGAYNMNAAQATAYFDGLKTKYTSLYNQFLTIQAQYPSTIAEYTSNNNGSVNRTMNVCNNSCYNIDCSNGTLDGWYAYYATDNSSTSSMSTSALVGGLAGSVPQAALDPTNNDYQVRVMSGSGVDPVCGSFIPVVSPLTNHSIRIGDSTAVLQGVAEATYSFNVSGPNPKLAIEYAVVLESGGHQGWQQPWFQMAILDQNGDTIPGCGRYQVVARGGNSGFVPYFYNNNTFDTVYCRSWTTVFVDLTAYVGQCVTAVFESSDCALGGHFGYAYVAASCSNPIIASSSNFFCGQSVITLTAPPGGATYQWSGPCISGASNQQQCQVTCPGTYSVTMTSSAGVTCGNTLTIVIGSGAGPVPVPDFTTDTVCSGNPTQFTNHSTPLGGNGTKFYWDFYDNYNYEDSTSVNPIWTFPLGGIYHVHLHETTSSGCGADTTVTVVVDTTSSVQIFGTTSACVGTPAYFNTGFFGNITGYTWHFGDPNCPADQDTSTAPFAFHTYSVAGTYTVSLKKGGFCPDSSTLTITVNNAPVENIIPHSHCGSDTVWFQATDSTNIGFYDWEFLNTNGMYIGFRFNNSDTTTFVFPYNDSSYVIVLHAYPSSGAFCPGVDTLRITLGHITPGFSEPFICVNKNVGFIDTSVGYPYTWLWNFGDPASGTSDTSSLKDPFHTYSATGVYNVKLVVTSASDCIDSVTNTITVNPGPVVSFTSDTLNGCAPLCIKFTDNSTTAIGNIVQWSWNMGNGIDTADQAEDPYICYPVGVYSVSLKVTTDSGCFTTKTISNMISAYGIPKAAYVTNSDSVSILDPNVTYTNQSSDATDTITNYLWRFSDSSFTMPNLHRYYPDTGHYCATLIVTNNHGCTDSVAQCVVVTPDFALYIPSAFTPNGNHLNDIFLPEGMDAEKYSMYIFNRWGTTLFHTTDPTVGWDGTVNEVMSPEDTYIYNISVTDSKGKTHNFIGTITLLR